VSHSNIQSAPDPTKEDREVVVTAVELAVADEQSAS